MRIQHIVQTPFLAEHLNKIHILTCILKHQQGSPHKNSDPNCLQTTNFDRFHREAASRAWGHRRIKFLITQLTMFPLCFHLQCTEVHG